MKPTSSARAKFSLNTWPVVLGLAVLAATPSAILAATAAPAAPTYGEPDNRFLPKTYPGGMPPVPVISSLQVSNQSVTVKWHGIGHPSEPFQLQRSLTLLPGSWQTVTSTWHTVATVLAEPYNTYRVTGEASEYAGASLCLLCHRFTSTTNWQHTAHATAYEAIKNMPPSVLPRCLPCHTVGYGSPYGFKDINTTPHLAGVQCENCHGPGNAHVQNPFDPNLRPKKDLSATVCGGCHTDSHHPTFDEFSTALHSRVDPHVQDYFTDPVSGESRMNSCGPCHSGLVRVNLLNGKALPLGDDAEHIGVTCGTCHDSHSVTKNGYQLRNPTFSTNFINWSTSIPFLSQYDPEVMVCGQCHNARGAKETDTSRPPHHSPQYNLLLGNLGVVTLTNGTPPMVPHWTIENQCVGCHMQTYSVDNPTETNPNGTGHTFVPNSREICMDCHTGDEEWLDLLVEFTQEATRDKIDQVHQKLKLWATTKAPANLRTKYGELAWEYNTPGQISNTTLRGPTTAEQAAVPLGIKQARFNMYLVEHDGSYGVHNNPYSRYLLKVAIELVDQELAK